MKSKLNLLIVDDDPCMLLTMESLLSQAFEVVTAEHGADALNLIKADKCRFDIVLTDLSMPELDGIQLLEQIQSLSKDICIIVVSGSEDIETAVHAMRQGAFDYVKKPLTSAMEIEGIVWRWQEHHSLEAKLDRYAKMHTDMMVNIRSRTFVSVDLVDSVGLKQGQDLFLVQYSFKQYIEFISAIVLSHGGIVHSTAGDGVMSCFVSPTSAVHAALQQLNELSTFNESKNRLHRPLKLRIGIHTGPVVMGENQQVSETFSHSVDIASRFQKQAEINDLLISETTYTNLDEMQSSFLPLDHQIEAVGAYKRVLADNIAVEIAM